MSWYSTERSLAEYEANLAARMKSEDLDDTPLVNLMLRCEGSDRPDAYLAPVFINKLRRALGDTSFTLIFVDQDLRPTGEPVSSIMTVDHMWRPLNNLSLRDKNFSIRTGYFMPYEHGPFDDSLGQGRESELTQIF